MLGRKQQADVLVDDHRPEVIRIEQRQLLLLALLLVALAVLPMIVDALFVPVMPTGYLSAPGPDPRAAGMAAVR